MGGLAIYRTNESVVVNNSMHDMDMIHVVHVVILKPCVYIYMWYFYSRTLKTIFMLYIIITW